MKTSKLFLLLMVLVLSFSLMFACGGGDDDDDDDSTVPDDDDATDDDDDDDATDDDDDDDDDATDDDDDDDDVTEYPSLNCALDDPESIGDGLLVGGGAIAGTIDVYVYDDATCEPIAGADVILDDTVAGTTDANGYLEITITKGAETVTAAAAGYWVWTYQADAAVMYFRLRPDDFGRTYTDSSDGEFTSGGTALGLTNPGFAGLFSNPIYLGLAVPGLSRDSLLSMDFDGLMADATFDLTLDMGDGPEATPLPANIYLPSINLTIPSLFGIQGENESYALPMWDDGSVFPIEGFVAGVSIAEALPGLADILALVTCIEGADNIGDYLVCADPLLVPLLNDALAFSYVGAAPDWDGSGAPDIETVEPGKGSFDLTIGSADSDYDYIAALAAEIPNRALVPMGLGLVDSGSAPLDYAEMTDASYVAAVVKTDLLTSELADQNLSFALKYTDDVADWASGLTVNDSDFLPDFADSSNYDGAGTVTWALDSKASVDSYYVVYIPACEDCPVAIAALPGTATSYTAPTAALGVTPAAEDIVIVIGIDLPDGVDTDEWNPVGILNYDSASVNLWVNISLIDLLGEL